MAAVAAVAAAEAAETVEAVEAVVGVRRCRNGWIQSTKTLARTVV